MRRVGGGFQFAGDLRVQYPELPFERCPLIHRERRPPRHFRHQLDVEVSLLQEGTNFVGECGLANAVCADQCKFQGLGYLKTQPSNTV